MKLPNHDDVVFQTAVAMAPAFRDKFEFNRNTSGDSHFGDGSDYNALADMAYQAAEALVAKYEAKITAREHGVKKE